MFTEQNKKDYHEPLLTSDEKQSSLHLSSNDFYSLFLQEIQLFKNKITLFTKKLKCDFSHAGCFTLFYKKLVHSASINQNIDKDLTLLELDSRFFLKNLNNFSHKKKQLSKKDINIIEDKLLELNLTLARTYARITLMNDKRSFGWANKFKEMKDPLSTLIDPPVINQHLNLEL